MRIKSENDILDINVRKTIIQEIDEGSEEQRRRDRAYMKHQCYRDLTKRFVIEQLLNQFEQTTVQQMDYAISNVSLVKKIIDKLARVYSSGVDRSVGESKELTESLEQLCKLLGVNQAMKTVNRFLKLQRNTLLYIKPCPYIKDSQEYMGVKLQPMSPHLYSVVEDYYDRERPLCVVLSNYEQRQKWRVSLEPSKEGRTYNTPQPNPLGDNKDQLIADTPEDQGHDDKNKKRFIFWTDSYHFTCNGKGEIVDKQGIPVVNPDEDMIANPIEELPFVDFGIDRDGSYWAYGGDDLVDGAVLVNSLISNMNHIAVTQGYGQMVMTGKNLPNNVLVGPDKVIKMEWEKDEDPQPTVEFLNANAPLSSLKEGIEMYVALLLTTNNLSTTGIAMQLQGTASMASGIALMIDKSESQEDVVDQQQIFLDKEPEMFRKINKWIQAIKEDSDRQIDPSLDEFQLPEGFEQELQVDFADPQPLLSESEHLDNLAKRKDLGISTMIDIIKMDQPGLTDEQAAEKLKAIMEEKLERAQSMMGDRVGDDVNENDGQGGQDNLTDEDDAVEGADD